jgi:RNAse (barnase) inhibitor barstar
VPIVDIATDRILDWNTFHDVFTELLGFPEFYGRNMDAWIDCLTHVDDEPPDLTTVSVAPGDVLTLQLQAVDRFAERCPEQYDALVTCSAFVNWRRIERGDRPILALSFYR